VLDRDSAGLDVVWRQSPAQNGGVKRLVIDGDVGIGELQVVNSRSALGTWDQRYRFDQKFNFGAGGPPDLPPSSNANAACDGSA
jgi:hypothetical protein